jgi:hypothetical protein
MKLTPENYMAEISEQAYKDASLIVDRLPEEAKDRLVYNVICCYIKEAYLMRVPFLKYDEEVAKRHEFLGFLIKLAEIGVDVRTTSPFPNSEPDHL